MADAMPAPPATPEGQISAAIAAAAAALAITVFTAAMMPPRRRAPAGLIDAYYRQPPDSH